MDFNSPLEIIEEEARAIDAITDMLERYEAVQEELEVIYEENRLLRKEIDVLKKKAEEVATSDGRNNDDDRTASGDIRNRQRSSDGNSSNRGTSVSDEAQVTSGSTYEATFYTARCEGCSGITYSGHDVRNTIHTPEGLRIIAVDPSMIAIGSIVRVTLSDGTSFKAEASDIGGDIKGSRIDILVATKEEALRLGRQDVTVEIIK